MLFSFERPGSVHGLGALGQLGSAEVVRAASVPVKKEVDRNKSQFLWLVSFSLYRVQLTGKGKHGSI